MIQFLSCFAKPDGIDNSVRMRINTSAFLDNISTMYIVFEWVVGVWKSTQSQKLATHLQTQYPDRKVHRTREPGGTEIAEAIRTLVQGTRFAEEMHALTDAYLYAAARAQLLNAYIKPRLDAWDIVVADRSFLTSLAYQGYTQWLGIERVMEINWEATKEVLPDLVLFLDLDVETWYSRTFDPEGDKRERQKIDFFTTAYEGYKKIPLIVKEVAPVWQEIDASGSPEEVYDRIVTLVADRMDRTEKKENRLKPPRLKGFKKKKQQERRSILA